MANKKEHLSWSRIALLHQCPQKYYFAYEEEIAGGQVFEYERDGETVRVPYSYDFALQFGTALHAAIATIYDGSAFEPVTCPCDSTCDFCERLFFAQGPREGFPFGGRWMYRCMAMFLLHYPWDPDFETDRRNNRTRERGVSLIHAYLEKWKKENFEVVAVEQEFKLDFGEFDFIGVIDLLLRSPDRKLSPMDHKSTRFFGSMFDDQFRISGQFTGYVKAAQAVTQELVNSAWANGIKIDGPIGEDSFKRLETSRTPDEIDAWAQEVQDAWDLIKLYRQRGRWPRHAPGSCFAYNRRCEYYILCESGPVPNEDLKRNNFVKKPPKED